ncbi:MAG: Eco57I restriction-modification methylase domain-containing protein, partial [bacterium]
MGIAITTLDRDVPVAKPHSLDGSGSFLSVVDSFRSAASPHLDTETRQQLGQFLTPSPVAEYMASLFARRYEELRVLDAGAGAGILSAALVQRQALGHPKPRMIAVTAYEIDAELLPYLRRTYAICADACRAAGIEFSVDIRHGDFIEEASRLVCNDLFSSGAPTYNAAIVNPPYGKIASDSRARLLLRSVGIETGNLYTGFVALIVKLLERNGELVAITPRSFCNGPYFQPFREMFLQEMSLRRVHVYESRTSAFRDDDVLQENVIVHAVKSAVQPNRFHRDIPPVAFLQHLGSQS